MDVERCESKENLEKNNSNQTGGEVVPKQTFPTFPSQIQVSPSMHYHAFLILKPFLDISYFTLTVPFRITKTANKGYTIQTNIIQKILSTFVTVFGTFYYLLEITQEYPSLLMTNHRFVLYYSARILERVILLSWFGTFWLKKEWFIKLLDVCQGRKEQCATLSFDNKISHQKKSVEPKWYVRGIVYASLLLNLAMAFQPLLNANLIGSKMVSLKHLGFSISNFSNEEYPMKNHNRSHLVAKLPFDFVCVRPSVCPPIFM